MKRRTLLQSLAAVPLLFQKGVASGEIQLPESNKSKVGTLSEFIKHPRTIGTGDWLRLECWGEIAGAVDRVVERKGSLVVNMPDIGSVTRFAMLTSIWLSNRYKMSRNVFVPEHNFVGLHHSLVKKHCISEPPAVMDLSANWCGIHPQSLVIDIPYLMQKPFWDGGSETFDSAIENAVLRGMGRSSSILVFGSRAGENDFTDQIVRSIKDVRPSQHFEHLIMPLVNASGKTLLDTTIYPYASPEYMRKTLGERHFHWQCQQGIG